MSFPLAKLHPRLLLLTLLLLFLFGINPPLSAAPMATFVVDRTDDNAGATGCTAAPNDCSLRGAITASNLAAGADTITLPGGTYTLSIGGTLEDNNATGDLDILDSVTIQGVSENTTFVDAAGIDRVFDVPPFLSGIRNVAFIDLTIQNGLTPATTGQNTGGAIAHRSLSGQLGVVNISLEEVRIRNNSTPNGSGGGIAVIRNGSLPAGTNPTVTIFTSNITNNTANALGSGGVGGGIWCNGCTLTVTNSTISGNVANQNGAGAASGGGGIYVLGSNSIVSISHTTISGNQTNSSGGGILLALGTGTVSLDFVTVANNRADADNDNQGNGGGISNNAGTFNIRNSIIADNNDGPTVTHPDCNGNINSQNYNLIENATGCTIGGTTTNNISGAPLINALADNGGPTIPAPQTHAVQSGSPVRNHIPNGTNGCVGGTTRDERGAIRAGGTASTGETGCEVGAFEFNSAPLAVTLAAFEATPVANGVSVTWETASEVGNVGFDVWRGNEATAPTDRLNTELIPSQSPGGGQGAAYEWLDDTAQTGQVYYYWLDAVDVNGTPTRFGPVSVESTPTAVTLSSFRSGTMPLIGWAASVLGGLLGVGILWRKARMA